MSSKDLFEFKFCINCGVRLPKKAESCTNCGAVNAHLTKSSAVCANCGAKLPFANTVAAEPPVRNSESHQSGQTGATYF